jgi:hypothetical protein
MSDGPWHGSVISMIGNLCKLIEDSKYMEINYGYFSTSSVGRCYASVLMNKPTSIFQDFRLERFSI